MNRRRLMQSGKDGTDPSQAAPLEVAFYNGSRIVIREESEWKDDEIPIGIVVVPGYHNRYGDGTCGIMSLVEMSYRYPQTGNIVSSSRQTDNTHMYWGHREEYIGNSIFSSKSINGTDASGMPYQVSSDSTTTTVYTDEDGYECDWVQWPYAGTKTSLASGKSETSDVVVPSMSATSGHAFGDFNGIKNTAACYVATKDSEQWTGSGVPNDTGASNTPPAACAGRFKTVGTKSFYDVYSGITSGSVNYGTNGDTHDYKGMWYLPAVGELCYLPSKRFEINKTILALNSKYGNVGTKLTFSEIQNYDYWSSSEYDNNNAFAVSMIRGIAYSSVKELGSSNCVRAFMRL